MSTIPCSLCRVKRPGKLASAYWAWFDAAGGRHAWKVRYCALCAPDALRALLGRLRSASGSPEVFACTYCGSSAAADSDPLYLTLYLPTLEPEEFAIQACGSCAVKQRIPIVDQGERLEDRNPLVRGPSPSASAWDALGLAPTGTV